MVTAYVTRAEGTGDGRDVTTTTSTQISRAEGRAVGFPMLTFGPALSPAESSDSLRLEILTPSGTVLDNDYQKRRGLRFSVEHNGAGSLGFELDLDQLTSGIDDAMIAPDNLVRVHFGDLTSWPYGIAEGFITSNPPAKDQTGRWPLQVSCDGSLNILEYGVLWPPDGATGDTREFSYTMGQTGPSWVPEEWGRPVGRLVKTSFRWNKRYPRGWPESKSRWLWDSSPESNSPEGERKFVSSTFTLTSTRNVHFYAAGDDNLKLYLNGARLKTKRRGAWHRTASFTRKLVAGTYTVAALVSNMPGGDNKSGFIFAAALLKADGTRDSWLLRSSETTFQVRKSGGYFAQVPLPPDGWYPAAVLRQHVAEAAGRGVRLHSGITVAYTATEDSYGTAWTDKGKAEYEIGMSGAQLTEDVTASGTDVAMLPGLQLSAWRHRGFDLRDRVVITQARSVSYTGRSWGRIRTVGVTHQESGWTATNGDVGGPYGRREMSISGGGQDGDVQADIFAAQAMATSASPEETIQAVTSTDDLRAGAPMPFRDYNVGDLITMETSGRLIGVKVMTISGEEDPTKRVTFTTQGYPV